MCIHTTAGIDKFKRTESAKRLGLMPLVAVMRGGPIAAAFVDPLNDSAIANAKRDLKAWHPNLSHFRTFEIDAVRRPKGRTSAENIKAATGEASPSIEFDTLDETKHLKTLRAYGYVAPSERTLRWRRAKARAAAILGINGDELAAPAPAKQ